MLTLICAYLPARHVWKEQIKWMDWRLSLKKLLRGVLKEKNKAWDKAKRFVKAPICRFHRMSLVILNPTPLSSLLLK